MRLPQALLALSIMGSGVVPAGCARRPLEIQAFAAALGSVRTVEPRLTGGFGFSPCAPEPGSAELVARVRCADPSTISRRTRVEVAVIANAVRRQAQAHRSSATLRAAGLVDLTLHGSAGDIDRAVRLLERARDAAPTDARAWSDLSAGYLVRAAARNDPYDLALALVAAEHAVTLPAASLPEARFNRALALEKLALAREARSAWTAYLALDPASPWSEEARRHLAALSEAPNDLDRYEGILVATAARGDRRAVAARVVEHPGAARELVELKLLGAWAEAHRRHDRPGSTRLLAVAHTIAAAIAARGESLALDAVAVIEEVSAAPDSSRLQALIRGHQAFAAGHGLYLQHRLQRAARELRTAMDELSRAGSPMAARASFFLACSEFLENRYRHSLDRLERLDAEISNAYPALRAHTVWMEALCRTALGKPFEAIHSYDQAIALFERLGEIDNAAWAHGLLAESLAKLGRRRLGWEHSVRALRTASKVGDPRRRFLLYTIAADRALENGQPEAAIYFRDEALRNGARCDPVLVADAWLWHGLAEYRLGRRGKAWSDLAQARRAIARQEDASQRRNKLSDLAVIEGMILGRDAPRRAVDRITAALAVYEANQDIILALTAHRLRAQAYRRLGDEARAEADLESAIAAYERMGEGIEDATVRQAFREQSSAVFDEMIALQVDLGKPGRALTFADREKTRALSPPAARQKGSARDRRGAPGLAPEALSEAATLRLLPAATALVQYSRLEDRLLTWVLRREGSQLFVQPVQHLDERIVNLRSAHTAGEWDEASEALFDQLVRPWARAVAGVSTLVIVPDKALHAVPFSTLRDARTGRLLVETYRIALCPSATLFLRSLAGGQTWSDIGRSRILIVGNPDFRRDLFPELSPLPGAEAEARAVADLYPDPVLLLGRDATRERFLAEAPRSRQIHFAGHYLLNSRNPLRSLLLLAPHGGEPGLIYASEISSLRLDRVSLVVLAACETGAAPLEESEGAASLAQAFLAGGAHAVLASLWKVDDDQATRLLIAFQRRLRAGAGPITALREAQLAALGDGGPGTRSPASWGAFEVVGASAP